MTSLRSLTAACLALAALCLATSFIHFDESLGAVRWLAVSAVLALTLGMFLQRRSSPAWLATTCLAGMVVMGALALLVGAPLYLVAPGVAATLAAWDLAASPLTGSRGPFSAAALRYERAHERSLGAALSIGLLLTAAGGILPLNLPFLPLLLMVILALFCFERTLRRLKGE